VLEITKRAANIPGGGSVVDIARKELWKLL